MIKNKTFYTNCQVVFDDILYRGIENGQRITKKFDYKPTLFLPSNKESKFKTLYGKPVEPIQFDCCVEARKFLKRYQDVEGFEVFGNTYFQYCYICDKFPHKIDYDLSDIWIANIDIETGSDNGFPEPESANEPVTAITVKMNGIFNVFGCGNYTPTSENIKYNKCSDENELLMRFIDYWKNNYPDALTGWNTTYFDIPYLVNRITKVCGAPIASKLSPWGRFTERTATIHGKLQKSFSILGISQLDYIELYKKYAPKNHQESYSLNHIAHVELNEKKLNYDAYGSLRNLYKENYQKFIEYNVQDVNLVDKIDQKLKLISLAIELAYDAKVNFNDIFGQVRMWDNIIFNELKNRHIVIPMNKDTNKESQYTGAFVKDPTIGLHKWIASFDINSLYPSLIQGFDISPENLVEDKRMNVSIDSLLNQEVDTSSLKKDDLTMAANGCFFRRNWTGIFPEMMARKYKERKEFKNKTIESEKELEEVKKEIERRGI
jgi:DNA polymerase elongation subunit (family B)